MVWEKNFLCVFIFIMTPILLFGQDSIVWEDIEPSIIKGLNQLVEWQHDDGSIYDDPIAYEKESVAVTGFALTKMCDYAYEKGYESPFDPEYPYYLNVIDGFNHLFSMARDDWGEGTGIYMFNLDASQSLWDPRHHEFYNASVGMMAVAACKTPDKLISEICTSNPVLDDVVTFKDLLDEMVQYFIWSQNSLSVFPVDPDDGFPDGEPINGYGGWGYKPGEFWRSDNSNTGFVVLALRYAEAAGCYIPPDLKTKLSVFIDYLQRDSDGGGSYAIPLDDTHVSLLQTGNLLFEMAFVGDDINTPRVQHALSYINDHWDDEDIIKGWGKGWDYGPTTPMERVNYLAMYCLMKGFESLSIDEIYANDVLIDWFQEFASFLINDWIFPWYDNNWGNASLGICWAMMVLERVAPPPPPQNQPPDILAITLPEDPIAISDQPVQVIVEYEDPDDPNAEDDYTVIFEYGDSHTETATATGFSCTSPDHTYDAPGVYTVTVTVADQDGGSDTEQATAYIVIYDASEGFVTGGGWIDSPEGAYISDPSLAGKASFGFVSKYKKGQTNPVGNTEFQFRAAQMNFHSSNYDWLVIAGPKAMYKGEGTINGTGRYGFMLSAIDAILTPSTDVDLFRIKIWDIDNGDALVYDNNPGDGDDADPATAISGGNIKIHKTGAGSVAVPGLEEGTIRPEDYALYQNYPNPFNPETTIRYQIPEDGHVRMEIYNAVGVKVRTLVDKVKTSGFYEVVWDTKDDRGQPLSTGIYFYRIECNAFRKIGKMIYMK
jgi:hypothetical protein